MELMVVIAIIAVISAITIPNMIGWFPRYRLGGGARDILSTLQSARTRAVKDNANVVVLFDPDGNGVLEGDFIAFVDNGANPNDWNRDADEAIVFQGTMPSGITIASASFNGLTRVRFNNRGFPTNSGAVQLANSRSETRLINLLVTGTTTIQ